MQEEWKKPGLTHFHLMQICCEIRRILSKNPNEIQLDHFEIKFKEEAKQRKPVAAQYDVDDSLLPEEFRTARDEQKAKMAEAIAAPQMAMWARILGAGPPPS